eukprot:14920102-Ditylum_brightwellii.AAC.1
MEGINTQLPPKTVPVPIVDVSTVIMGVKFHVPSPMGITHTETASSPDSFEDCVTMLPKWERDIISGTEMLIEEEDICEILQDEITLCLVPDGGVGNGFGYFRWVIGMHMKEIAQHTGHAAGSPTLMELLGTESIGALPLLCFITHFYQYHQVNINANTWTHVCDNKMIV